MPFLCFAPALFIIKVSSVFLSVVFAVYLGAKGYESVGTSALSASVWGIQ
jgi:hypothetical protein